MSAVFPVFPVLETLGTLETLETLGTLETLETLRTLYNYTADAIRYKIQKHFLNVTLVGMASENSKNYTYKCVDRSRHNGIKGAKVKCAH